MNAPNEFPAIKARQQAAWSSGDYAVIGTTLQIVGEQLAEACDLNWDERVLDVAAGNGNATLAAARRGCRVTASDYVAPLLERAAERARAERLDVTFEVADAEALPFADATFDAVLSTFGVMFAPDHARAAAELARVCRPGGRIGLANWTPESMVGRMFKVLGRHVPPPAGVQSPALWGVKEHVSQLFGASAAAIAVTPRVFNFRYRSAAHFIEVFRTWYGPVHKAFGALPAEGAAALARDLAALLEETEPVDDERARRAGRIPRDRRHATLTPHGVEARLQRRVQRYGWDLAAAAYEPLWRDPARDRARRRAGARRAGARSSACSTSPAEPAWSRCRRHARSAPPEASPASTCPVAWSTRRCAGPRAKASTNAAFARMDAERLDVPAAAFDVVLCALGLMYVPDPARAMRGMRRALRAGGRAVVAVWGARARCGWAPLFDIVDAEVASEVCPLFFALGAPGALAQLLGATGFCTVEEVRIDATLDYAGPDDACDAAFAAGPVALAWSRFADDVRARVRDRYLAAIACWRRGRGYRIPGEFVVAAASPASGVDGTAASRVASGFEDNAASRVASGFDGSAASRVASRVASGDGGARALRIASASDHTADA